MTVDVRKLFLPETIARDTRGISTMADEIILSEILEIAYDVRSQIEAGADVLNLTVGDFNSQEFPVPSFLAESVQAAYREGHTNYPPSIGVLACRRSVQRFAKRRLGLDYPLESILIAGGARPMLAGTYLCLLDPGERVVYGAPSWNNNHYCTLSGAERVPIATKVSDRFFPSPAAIEPELATARLLCLNSPQNPTGTVMKADDLRDLCQMAVDENRRRRSKGQKALYLVFDQVYWMLTFDGVEHRTPVNLVPEVAPYTILVDGISKAFAATGVRVGWALGPPDIIDRMNTVVTHLGAWSPRPEQVATGPLLDNDEAVDAHLKTMRGSVLSRLKELNCAIETLKSEGHDVDAVPPQGAIYLSMRFNLSGRKTPSGDILRTDEDIRCFLLNEAGIALVPFSCFGVLEDSGWFRASVGAVSLSECQTILPRLRRALEKLAG